MHIDLLYKSGWCLSTENCWHDKAVQIVGDSTLKVSVVQRSAVMGSPGLFFHQVCPHNATLLPQSSQLPSTRVSLLKEMKLVPNKDIIVTHNIKVRRLTVFFFAMFYRALLSLRGRNCPPCLSLIWYSFHVSLYIVRILTVTFLFNYS